MTAAATPAQATTESSNFRPEADAGIAALCRGMATNRTLKSLSLRYCDIGVAGACAIVTLLRSPLTVLETIDLSGNPLGAPGLAVIAQAARTSRTLQELRLSDCGIGGGHMIALNTGADLSAVTSLLQQHAPSTASGGPVLPQVVPATSGDATEAVPDTATQASGPLKPAGLPMGSLPLPPDCLAGATTGAGAAVPASIAVGAWTRYALTLLGQALADSGCPLCRVRIDSNGVSPDDARRALLPYVARGVNTKVAELFVDETLPRELFVQLERTGALEAPGGGPGKAKAAGGKGGKAAGKK